MAESKEEYLPGISHGKTYEVGDTIIYTADNTKCIITHIAIKKNGVSDPSLVALIRAKDKNGRNVIAAAQWFSAPNEN